MTYCEVEDRVLKGEVEVLYWQGQYAIVLESSEGSLHQGLRPSVDRGILIEVEVLGNPLNCLPLMPRQPVP